MIRRFAMPLLFIALLAGLSAPAQAELYRWVDEQGVVTYKDTPPPARVKKGSVRVYQGQDFAPAPPVAAPAADRPATARETTDSPRPPKSARAAQSAAQVELYKTVWCGYCRQAESYLQRRGIAYTSYDIEQDPAAKRRYKELGGRGVPFIVVGSQTLAGFSPQALDQLLGRQ